MKTYILNLLSLCSSLALPLAQLPTQPTPGRPAGTLGHWDVGTVGEIGSVPGNPNVAPLPPSPPVPPQEQQSQSPSGTSNSNAPSTNNAANTGTNAGNTGTIGNPGGNLQANPPSTPSTSNPDPNTSTRLPLQSMVAIIILASVAGLVLLAFIIKDVRKRLSEDTRNETIPIEFNRPVPFEVNPSDVLGDDGVVGYKSPSVQSVIKEEHNKEVKEVTKEQNETVYENSEHHDESVIDNQPNNLVADTKTLMAAAAKLNSEQPTTESSHKTEVEQPLTLQTLEKKASNLSVNTLDRMTPVSAAKTPEITRLGFEFDEEMSIEDKMLTSAEEKEKDEIISRSRSKSALSELVSLKPNEIQVQDEVDHEPLLSEENYVGYLKRLIEKNESR